MAIAVEQICVGGWMPRALQGLLVLRPLMLALAVAVPVTLVAASAQVPRPRPQVPAEAERPAAPDVDTLKERDRALEAIRAQQRKALENEAKLKREIESIGDDRRKFNQQIIDTAARVIGVEVRIAQTQDRLQPLEDQEQSLRDFLDERRGLIAEVLAALQRIGRHAAPALLVRPEDALASVRSAMVLRAGEAHRSGNGRPDLAALKDPGRLSPAVAFASIKGTLALPVNGVRIREFGAPDGYGGTEKGLSIAARPEGQVTSPCDGWVVYAGVFRNYGQLLILNAGGGYHVLLAGMERISVDLGQFVVTGEPVAVMGGGAQSAAVT